MRTSFLTSSLVTSTLCAVIAACGGKTETPAGNGTVAAGGTGTAGGAPRVIDLKDNDQIAEVAFGSLLAYRDKNMERLADLGPPGAREKLIFIEPRNPHYEELLGDGTWQMKSLRAWDGKKESVKVRRGVDTALGYYGEDAENSYVVEVRQETFKACRDGKKGCKADADCGEGNVCESQTRWCFHNLKKLPKSGSLPAPSPDNTLKIGEPKAETAPPAPAPDAAP